MKSVRHILPTGWVGENGMENLAETLDVICRMLNGLDVVEGGSVYVDKDKIWIRASRQLFNGTAYTPAGVKYEDLTDATKPWLKYDLATGIITEETGPPSEPWGANEIWRKKSDFSGAVYF